VELQTASMRDDYKTEPKKTNPYCDEPTIENILRKALDKNFQFTIKTVGDKAVNNTLNIIEKISKEKKLDNPRIKFDGIEFVQSSDINRLKEFKIIPSIKPEACLYDIDVIPLKIPISNLKNFALWNTLLQNCGMITTSSGFPFSHSINPFVQIYYLTNRQFLDTLRNDIPSDNQKLSILDALKSYTIWPAYSGFEEDIKGSLEKGKFADMIVISDDIFNIDSKKLPNIKVLKTIIDGKLCYEYKE
jgi:predicted amidohydrolase YtcJ